MKMEKDCFCCGDIEEESLGAYQEAEGIKYYFCQRCTKKGHTIDVVLRNE